MNISYQELLKLHHCYQKPQVEHATHNQQHWDAQWSMSTMRSWISHREIRNSHKQRYRSQDELVPNMHLKLFFISNSQQDVVFSFSTTVIAIFCCNVHISNIRVLQNTRRVYKETVKSKSSFYILQYFQYSYSIKQRKQKSTKINFIQKWRTITKHWALPVLKKNQLMKFSIGQTLSGNL